MVSYEKIRACFQSLSAVARSGCGLSDGLYASRYSEAVERLVSGYPDGQREILLNIAREEGDYRTQEEIEKSNEGCCQHGLDPECCPVGCGDFFEGNEG